MKTKGPNLTEKNKDYAIFLPSISSAYSRFASEYYRIDGELSPRNGVHPDYMEHGFKSLDFLDPDKGLFYYKHALYSAGHAQLGIEQTNKVESMVSLRDRSNTWILGDSGGYQVINGLLKFPMHDLHSQDADDMRFKIMNWLEYTADYAMLLDFPTSSITNPKSPLNSFRECLEGSLQNFNYFMRNRQGKTKYLNVLQGRSLTESNTWFDEVKDFPFEGWAFGGGHNNDFEIILNRIITLRDGKYFEENSNGDKRDWIHVLGQSRLTAGCTLSHLQRLLRKQLNNKNLSISYDSASAFIAVAHGQIYTNDVFEKKRFSYIMDKMYDDKDLVGSDKPFPWRSTIGDLLTMGDICVKTDAWYQNSGKTGNTSWDSYSYALMMMHNVERHIRAIQQANMIYDLSDNIGVTFMPPKLAEFKEVLEHVFESETPFTVITENYKLLNDILGRRTGKGSIDNTALTTMFEMPVVKMPEIDYEDQNDPLLEAINLDNLFS